MPENFFVESFVASNKWISHRTKFQVYTLKRKAVLQLKQKKKKKKNTKENENLVNTRVPRSSSGDATEIYARRECLSFAATLRGLDARLVEVITSLYLTLSASIEEPTALVVAARRFISLFASFCCSAAAQAEHYRRTRERRPGGRRPLRRRR